MLHLVTTAALAQTWSYGYYTDKTCSTPSTAAGFTLDGGTEMELTGMAIGKCITSKYGSLEWSMQLKSCATDADGRFTEVIEVRAAITGKNDSPPSPS